MGSVLVTCVKYLVAFHSLVWQTEGWWPDVNQVLRAPQWALPYQSAWCYQTVATSSICDGLIDLASWYIFQIEPTQARPGQFRCRAVVHTTKCYAAVSFDIKSFIFVFIIHTDLLISLKYLIRIGLVWYDVLRYDSIAFDCLCFRSVLFCMLVIVTKCFALFW